MGVTPSFFIEKNECINKTSYSFFISMSRDEFKNFVRNVEHNILVKEKLLQCKTAKDLILLAKKYGYSITLKDLAYDETATKFESWVKESKINALKY